MVWWSGNPFKQPSEGLFTRPLKRPFRPPYLKTALRSLIACSEGVQATEKLPPKAVESFRAC